MLDLLGCQAHTTPRLHVVCGRGCAALGRGHVPITQVKNKLSIVNQDHETSPQKTVHDNFELFQVSQQLPPRAATNDGSSSKETSGVTAARQQDRH